MLIRHPGFPDGSGVMNLPASVEDSDSVLGVGRSLAGGNGNPFRYSILGNPMERGAWCTTVHGVTKSQTRLSD